MRCSKCGSYIDDNLNICPICGNGFKAMEEVDTIQSEIGSRVGDIMNSDGVAMSGMNDGVEINDGHMDAVHSDDISKTIIFEEPDTVFTNAGSDMAKAAQIRAAMEREGVYNSSSSFARHAETLDEDSFRTHHTTHIDAVEIRAQEQRWNEAQRGEADRRSAAKKETPTSHTEQARSRNETPVSRKKAQAPRVSDIQLSDEELEERDDMAGRRQKEPVNITLILGLIVAAIAIAFVAYMILSGKYLKVLGLEKKETTAETVVVGEDKITSSLLENGIYVLPLEIKLESTENNAMYFTFDGTEPSVKSWPYTGGIQLNDNFISEDQKELVLRVFSFDESLKKKADYTIKFTIKHSEVEEPVLSHVSGNYNTAQGITITAEKGTVIYYTYDGSTPTRESAVYTGAVTMLKGTNTLSAIAYKGDRASNVVSATYTLELTPKYTYEDAAAIIAAKLKADGYKVAEKPPKKPEPVVKPTQGSKDGDETEPETEPETTFDQTKTAVLVNGGEFTSGQNKYLVVEAVIYSSIGDIVDTQFYGVDDQNGSIEHMGFSGGNMTAGN